MQGGQDVCAMRKNAHGTGDTFLLRREASHFVPKENDRRFPKKKEGEHGQALRSTDTVDLEEETACGQVG